MALKIFVKRLSGRKRGALLTLATLVLFILMLAEIIAYVTLNLTYSSQASQSFASFGVSTFASTLKNEFPPLLATSLQVALGNYLPVNAPLIYPINASAANSLASLVNTGTILATTYGVMNSITINSITNSIENQAGFQGLNVIIANQSVTVFQTNPLFLNATYYGFAFVNSSSGSFAFPINASAGVPLAVAYVNVTLRNSQASATNSPYQQIIAFNAVTAYPSYESGDLGNVRFYHGSSPLYSWCTSGCTSGSNNAVFSVQLNVAIPATSNAILQMALLPKTIKYSASKAEAYAVQGAAPNLPTPVMPAVTFGNVVTVR